MNKIFRGEKLLCIFRVTYNFTIELTRIHFAIAKCEVLIWTLLRIFNVGCAYVSIWYYTVFKCEKQPFQVVSEDKLHGKS